jgi:putative ABC transport system permease protein
VDEVRKRARAPKMTKHRTPPLPLRDEEMTLLRTGIENVRAVAGSIEGNVALSPAPGISTRIARVHGIESAWPEMRGWKLIKGRLVSDAEHQSGAPVALVSTVVSERLWPGADPLGRTLEVGGSQVKIVGTVEVPAGDVGSAIVPNLYLTMPLAQKLLRRDSFDLITVRTTSVATTTGVAQSIKEKLRALREVPEDTLDDFRVETQSVSAMPSMGMDPRLARSVHANVVGFEQASWEEMAKSLRAAGRTFTLLLAAAAAVSLLVGGIGVMNIMLVSVAARTREIGLRMALGARMNDVLVQFLVEAVTLAALGGLIGLVLGAAGLLFAKHGFHWATAISPSMLIAAVGMAALTGIIFGYGPARRAAVLDPVVALKSE